MIHTSYDLLRLLIKDFTEREFQDFMEVLKLQSFTLS